MNKHNVYKRTTFKYNDAYRHLDESHFIGTVVLGDAKHTPPTDESSFDDGGTYVRLATLPAGLNRRQRADMRAALAENLSKWGCSHEYDCCGCSLVRTVAHATNHARRVVLVSSVSFNY